MAAILVGALVGSASAGMVDEELVDVEKTVRGLEEKLADLRERGGWAHRGDLSAAADCAEREASAVFSAWGDESDYVPAPEGDLETADGWSLDKHASLVPENTPFGAGARSLFLAEKGEAISPAFCVTTAHPTIRLFAVNTGDPEARLEVEIYYEHLDGKVKKLRVARLRGGPSWAPTTIVPLHVNMLGAAAEDGYTAIAVKLKAKDSKSHTGGWKIDDLYVDPFRSR
jgi:hypothetical protein